MSIYIFTKSKGLATTIVGLVTVLFPETLFTILELPLSANGFVIAKLLGLLAISFGVSTFLFSKNRTFSKRDCLINVLTDSLSVVVLCNAYLNSLMGDNGLLLVTFYIVSASGFLYCFIRLRTTQDSRTEYL